MSATDLAHDDDDDDDDDTTGMGGSSDGMSMKMPRE